MIATAVWVCMAKKSFAPENLEATKVWLFSTLDFTFFAIGPFLALRAIYNELKKEGKG